MDARWPGRRRWFDIIAGVILLCAAGLVGGVTGVGLVLSAPSRAIISAPPAGLNVEPVTIPSRSSATLAGWFIAGRSGGGAVVLMHGVHANRLSMVRRARMLNAEGFAVLLFDFQAHGESTGARITFGWREGFDAESAVTWLRARVPGERIGAIGSSLGGAAALLATSPLAVDALVIESVYSDIGTAIANRIRVVLGDALGGIVARPVARLFELVLPPIIRVSPDNLRPIDMIARIKAPLLMASGTLDTRTTIAEARAMFERAPEPKSLWVVEGMGHFDLEGFAPDEYRRRVVTFLAARLRQPR